MALSIVTDPQAWEAALQRLERPSVLARYAHVRAAAVLEPGAVAEAAVWETAAGLVFHPYLKRPIPGDGGLWDLVSPYDFGGLWFSPLDPASRMETAQAFGDAFAAHARSAGIVSAFIRVHPFTDAAAVAATGYRLHCHQDNVVVDLSLPLETVRAGYSRARRKQIRQGYEHGLIAVRSDDIAGFTALYHENMRRLNAAPFYLFPRDFMDSLAPLLLLMEARGPDGGVHARHAYLPDGDVLFAFLCHAHAESLALRPNDFLYDAMIAEARTQGFRWLHLGGGAETLYNFKKSFSPATVPFHHARHVFLEREYDALVSQRCMTNANFKPGRFFPAYRAPTEAVD